MECLDCGKKVKRRFIDVEEPPLAEGECLCSDCAVMHTNEAIDRAVDQILRLKMFKAEVNKIAKTATCLTMNVDNPVYRHDEIDDIGVEIDYCTTGEHYGTTWFANDPDRAVRKWKSFTKPTE